MILTVLIPLTILALVAVIGVALVRARDGLDLSPRGLVRGYLYLASLAGVLTLAVGAASLANWGLAATFGTGYVYGEHRAVPAPVPCPPGVSGCVEPAPERLAQQQRQQDEQRRRQHAEDLVRGATFAAFGAAFWAAHWIARRAIAGERGSPLRRVYLMVGTVIFGLATILLVPTGVYQLLSFVAVPVSEGQFRGGADALGGAIAVLPLWLLYLRLIVAEFRDAPARA